jgi:hypothetical protein
MPSNIFDAYAEKICCHAELSSGTYYSNDLNDVVLSLPLGEAHAVVDGIELGDLPKMGKDIDLRARMQRYFFDVLGSDHLELHEFTKPFLLSRAHLERLDGWREWRTLAAHLEQSCLHPTLVFRNTPLPLHQVYEGGVVETVEYYVSEVRVMFARSEPFDWKRM